LRELASTVIGGPGAGCVQSGPLSVGRHNVNRILMPTTLPPPEIGTAVALCSRAVTGSLAGLGKTEPEADPEHVYLPIRLPSPSASSR
jgi:hypothetical protein